MLVPRTVSTLALFFVQVFDLVGISLGRILNCFWLSRHGFRHNFGCYLACFVEKVSIQFRRQRGVCGGESGASEPQTPPPPLLE